MHVYFFDASGDLPFSSFLGTFGHHAAVVRRTLGSQSVNLLPVAQGSNILASGVVGRTRPAREITMVKG